MYTILNTTVSFLDNGNETRMLYFILVTFSVSKSNQEKRLVNV